MTTPTPRTVRLRSGIKTVNGITGETAPTYSEYVLLEDYERDLAAAQEARQAAEARAESYKATIDRARRVMGGEGVEDQGQAWDQCLRILDAAIDAAQEKP